MKNISIIGFGELGQQYLGYLNDNNIIFNIYDDNYKSNSPNIIQSPFLSFRNFNSDVYYVALGYKNSKLKLEILNELLKQKKSIPCYIHKSSFVNDTAFIHSAVIVYPMANIDKKVEIGIGTLINNSVIISHDSKIGKCCYLSPGVIISGFVEVGDFTFIGSGSIISNNVKIGKNVTIGIGTVITKDIPDNSNVIGNPYRILEKSINLT